MKQISYPIVFLLLLTLLAASCRKREQIQKASTYSFTNQTDRILTFDFYNNEADYALNANRLQQRQILPGQKAQIELEALKTYWIDWYSPDYSLNNWRSSFAGSSDRPYPPAELTVAAMDDQFLVSADPDTSRSVLVGGGGTSSTWLAKLENEVAMNGTHRIIFRKDFRGEYTYTDAAGTSFYTPITYSVTSRMFYNNIPQGFDLSIMNDQRAEIINARFQLGPFTYQPTGRDTMLLTFVQSSPYYNSYPAVRQ